MTQDGGRRCVHLVLSLIFYLVKDGTVEGSAVNHRSNVHPTLGIMKLARTCQATETSCYPGVPLLNTPKLHLKDKLSLQLCDELVF